MNIAELVEQHVPLRHKRGNWDDVLRRADVAAQRRWRRRGFVLAVAATLAVALGSTFAVAASQGWWFLRSEGTPQPIGSVDVVRTGSWNGQQWILTAYRTAYWPWKDSVCFGITQGPETNTAGEGASACADVPGELKLTFLSASQFGVRYVVGPVLESAERVRITLTDRQTVETPTFSVPADLGQLRFYATTLPSDARVASLVGLDADGHEVARLQP